MTVGKESPALLWQGHIWKNGRRNPPTGQLRESSNWSKQFPTWDNISKRGGILHDILIYPLQQGSLIMFWPNSCLTFILAPSQRFIKSTRRQAAFDVLITCLFLHALLHVDSLGNKGKSKYFTVRVCGGYWLTERRELNVNTSFVLGSMRGDSSGRFKDAGSSWESQRALSSHCHDHLTCPLLHLHPPPTSRHLSPHLEFILPALVLFH